MERTPGISRGRRAAHDSVRRRGSARVAAAGAVGAALFALALPVGASAADAHCPDAPIRPTIAGGYPAGCYVYEKVSPADKGTGEVFGGLNLAIRAAESGDRAFFTTDSAFAGAPHLFQINPYSSARGASAWSTRSVNALAPSVVPNDYTSPDFPVNVMPDGLSADGTKVILGSNKDPETGAAIPGRPYRVDLVTGERTPIAPDPVTGDQRVEINEVKGSATDGTRDFSTVLFTAGSILTNDANGGGLTEWDHKLYHYSDGTTRLASYSPSGVVQRGLTVAARNDIVAGGGAPRQFRNSVSSDGRRYFYIQGDPAGPHDTFAGYPLFRGEAGVPSSVRVDATEHSTVPDQGAGSIFHAATPDAGRAYFTSKRQLVDGVPFVPVGSSSHVGQLYRYTHSSDPANDQNLTWISKDDEPADGASDSITRVIGSSADASAIYFVNESQLVPGESTAPGSKLFRWTDAGLEFLRVLPATVPMASRSQVSDDGRFMIFEAGTGVNRQLYRYDAESDQVDCVSCPPQGAPQSAIRFPENPASGWVTSAPHRWLSSDGRVTFVTKDALLPQDTNGLIDAYTWKDGRLSLVSTGRANRDVQLADASADGKAIFFVTNEQLSGWDEDTRMDLYVARVDGGLPEPNPRPAETCAGDSCQGARTPAPPAPLIGSVTFTGTGDVVSPPWVSGAPRVSRVQAVRSRQATLRISVPGEGRIRVSGNRLQRVNRSASKAQRLNVRVRLSNLGERTRKRRGQVKVNVAVRFTPSEGRVRTVRVPVTFRANRSSSSRSSSTTGAKSKSKASAKSAATSSAKGGR